MKKNKKGVFIYIDKYKKKKIIILKYFEKYSIKIGKNKFFLKK